MEVAETSAGISDADHAPGVDKVVLAPADAGYPIAPRCPTQLGHRSHQGLPAPPAGMKGPSQVGDPIRWSSNRLRPGERV